MKTTPVSSLLASTLCALLYTIPAFADSQTRKERRNRPPAEHNPTDAWKKADENNDNKLSFNEFSSLPRLQAIPEEKRHNLFQRLDKDTSNFLTIQEMQRMRPKNPDGKNRRRRIWELDTDQSGGISSEEFFSGEMFQKMPLERRKALFERLDTNQDGNITPDDRPKPDRNKQGRSRKWQVDDTKPLHPSTLFPSLDTNQDSLLDFDEFTLIPRINKLDEDEQEQAFDRIDINNDLKISPDEMDKFQQLNRRNNKRLRPDNPQGGS